MMQLFVICILCLLAVCAFLFVRGRGTSEKRLNTKTAPKSLGRKYAAFKLAEKTPISHNTFRFKFSLPSESHILGLPVGKHMRLKFTDEEEEDIIRSYTPTSSDDDLGFFELVIKVYDAGLMTQHLKAMNIGDSILAAGPIGKLEYTSPGAITVKSKGKLVTTNVQKIGMIAGGTGITPMLQIVRDVAKHSNDNTEISLIFANVTEEDILCREELERYASAMPNIKVHYTLDKPDEKWTGSKGFVTAEMIQAHLPGPSEKAVILMCGPPPMIGFMEKNLKGLDYQKEQYHKF